MRRFALLLLALGAAQAAGAAGPDAPEPAVNLVRPDLSSPNGDLEMDFQGNYTITGGAIWRQGAMEVTSDQLKYDRRFNVMYLTGHVTMTDGEERILADYLEYHRADGSFLARDVRITPRYPIILQGQWAEGRGRQITIHDAIVTYTDPGRWKPSIKAHTIVYEPGHYLRTVRSVIGLSGAEVIPLGNLRENLNQVISESILSFNVGYRSTLGGILGVGVHYPLFPNVRVGGDATWFTARGLMVGPAFTYIDPDGNLRDTLTSGLIEDHGRRADDYVPESPQGPQGIIPPAPLNLDPRGYDLLDNPVPEQREFVTWEHQQSWDGDNLSVNGELNYWSDSDVIRDFSPKQYYPVQTPDNFLEGMYTGLDDFAWVFTRFEPDTFVDVQQRLPELGYEVAPIAIGDGFFERLEATADDLREVPPLGGPTLSDQRIDAFYGISRPIGLTPWATFTPVAGARLTDYLDTEGAEIDNGRDYLRTLGEIGFDLNAVANGTFDYQNATWGIDGLRHLIEPEITYRYIPNANEGQDRIPQIDIPSFTTALEPLDLGDLRYIDQLEPIDTLRIGAENILQTRQAGYGSTNLVDLAVADDINFHRSLSEPDLSDVHTDLAITPAHWLEYDLGNIFSTTTLEQREIDNTLILRDADAWTLQLANDFLRHEDDDYLLNFSVQIDEQYEALLLLDYDARLHGWPERAVGVVQTLANTWRIRYLLTWNGTPSREAGFGEQVEAEVLKF